MTLALVLPPNSTPGQPHYVGGILGAAGSCWDPRQVLEVSSQCRVWIVRVQV